ncbi:hypothetical protein D3C80_1799400 [compost metagenome]
MSACTGGWETKLECSNANGSLTKDSGVTMRRIASALTQAAARWLRFIPRIPTGIRPLP